MSTVTPTTTPEPLLDQAKAFSVSLGLGLKLLPVVLRALSLYYTYGPPEKSWSLKFYIVWSCARYLLYTNNAHPRIVAAQSFTRMENPSTSTKAIITAVEVPRDPLAVEFIVKASRHLPVYARNLDEPIRGEWITTPTISSECRLVIYHLHGGAYMMGSMQIERPVGYHIANMSRIPVFGISYRLAPQYEYPCALVDALSGYFFLLAQGYLPNNICISGCSAGMADGQTNDAGGGLAMATLLALRDMNVPRPGCAYLISPWVDLAMTFPSFSRNKDKDYLPSRDRTTLGERHHSYVPNELLKDCYVSPVWCKSLSGIDTNVLIQLGMSERLVDEGTELGRRLVEENTGVCRVEIYREQVHVFQTFSFLPCSKVALRRAGVFINQVLQKHEKPASNVLYFSPHGAQEACKL
ncbi:hypothetical protein HDV03_000773 [Kappamyces sp. JEL0829]|nr:hypothetical protein HDV03_000773 [Kappamyces sp. JEL0829]